MCLDSSERSIFFLIAAFVTAVARLLADANDDDAIDRQWDDDDKHSLSLCTSPPGRVLHLAIITTHTVFE